MDLFVVPTISFRLLYGLLIMGHGRRQILWFGVTAHPTAEWIANQLTEACGWEQIPRYLIRDRDRAYGEIFVRRVRSIGIRDRPTSSRSPWQNAYAERLIGSIRRECIDHVVVFGERHIAMNLQAPSVTAWRLYRSAISARLVYLREIGRTAFWEFCNTIGTFRTWRDVRLESGMSTKADV